jgi:hypothetical protein
MHAVYQFPEMNPKTAGHDTDTWCYAVKEHIEFGSANKLLVRTPATRSSLKK